MPGAIASRVSVRDLSCGYGEQMVLRQLTLELPRDRTYALLGPGGAGKSTLLGLLAARRNVDATFWQEGDLVRRGTGSLGFLRQRSLDEGRSLLELLCTPERDAVAAESSALGVWNRTPAAQQMLLSVLDLPLRVLPTSLARFAAFTVVLAEEPEVLLLDEPDSEMDGEFRTWITEQLLYLKGRCTVVIATHHLKLAREVSHHCALLVSGRLIECGPTDELFERPRLERTRQFIELGN